jgi:ATP-dependent RNA helicase HelY
MLPAIYFIFSRAACDDAVKQCLDSGLRLTTPEEAAAIRAIAEARTEILSGDDLAVLGYGRWLAALEAGIASHHAGMVPPFKETVEACFSAGLVKAVFATETLALGINMPARTVVIEKLSKFTGERHEFLTPGEYTQLTGRAGRRGIDDIGYAVVLWSPYVPFDQVAGLASTRTYALKSSFRPTYNMAANLVRRYPPEAARHLLNLSFAQFTSDRDVVRLEAQVERTTALLALARDEAACELGDIEEYRRLLRADDDDGRPRRASARSGVVAALEKVKPGDVLMVSGGKSAGRVAVISTANRRGDDVRIGALTPDRRFLTLSARDFRFPPRTVGRVELPVPYAPRNPVFRREVAQSLSRLRPSQPVTEKHARAGQNVTGSPEEHPVAGCPDVRRHLRSADRAERLEKDRRRLERRIDGRTESLARQFDRVLRILETWGYVEGWGLTEAGEVLARIYHECDLLVADALRGGLFDGLDATGIAALASTFTYEARRADNRPEEPWFPSSRLKRRWSELEGMATELNGAEEEAGLPLTRRPDPGFVPHAHGWASGEELSEVIVEEGLSGGDFVRNVKQLIDLVRQLGQMAPEPATAKSARDAADRLFRGVVAASSVIGG